MERYNTKLSKIIRSEGGINSDEKFELRQDYVNGLMRLLTIVELDYDAKTVVKQDGIL